MRLVVFVDQGNSISRGTVNQQIFLLLRLNTGTFAMIQVGLEYVKLQNSLNFLIRSVVWQTPVAPLVIAVIKLEL